MRVDLVKSYRFEAAHETPYHGSKCLHGHSYEVEIVVRGECDAQLGWLMDYAEISERFDPCFKALDHRLLNEVDGLADPSLAGIERWLTEHLQPRIPALAKIRVAIAGECRYNPTRVDDSRPRLRFGFEAAHALPQLPESHKCRRMHGHSFGVELSADSPETLESSARRVYDQLDHGCLNRIGGLENPTSEHVSRWIWNEVAPKTRDLREVSVAETCTARCLYHGQ